MEKKYELVFDIGANIGAFSEKILSFNENCKIILIEPNDDLKKTLEDKFIGKNVEILNFIVSEKSNEIIKFHISNADKISTASVDWILNSRFSNNYEWNKVVKKLSINLEDLIKKYGNPDLIKIDVEGYEYEVIKGLVSKQKEICFEWAEEKYEDINKTCEYLEKIGYDQFGFIYGDEYLKKPNLYSSWKDCNIHNDINPFRKEKWGMIWVK